MHANVAGPGQTLAFAAAVCVGCAIAVAIAAVGLRDRQAKNAAVDLQRNVLEAAGLLTPETRLPAAEIEARAEQIATRAIPTRRGAVTIYEVRDESGELVTFVLPIEAKGMWSTMHGFVALDADRVTIRGITFYAHGETPGLGGRVDDPAWKARWPGRRAYDAEGRVRIHLGKGSVGSPADDPFVVDALSGATITGRGVTRGLQQWLGEDGYGPWLTGRSP